MRTSSNVYALSAYKNSKIASNALSSNMKRLSSGKQMIRPGDNPTRYAFANTLRVSLKRSNKALENIHQVRAMMHTADQYLETVGSVLSRMSELTVSAFDDTKNPNDRAIISQEFDALKSDISDIARKMKINGVDFLSRQQVLSFDKTEQKFFLSQIDGSEKYMIDQVVASGVPTLGNGADFLFSASSPYTLSQDGKNIYYVDNNEQLVSFDIEKKEILRDAASSDVAGMNVDEEGRLWYTSELSSGVYGLREQNLGLWEQDTDWIKSDSINDMSSPEFSIYKDRIYYANSAGSIISRDLKDLDDQRVEIDSNAYSPPLQIVDKQFALSEDGMFAADMSSSGVVRLISAETDEYAQFILPDDVIVKDLKISRDNHEIMFIDDNTGSIMRIGIDHDGLNASLKDYEAVHTVTSGSGFEGLSLDGGSNRGNILMQQGPDKGQFSEVQLGDISIYNLGLTRVSLHDVAHAEVAFDSLQEALDKVYEQRATIGVKESTLRFTTDSLSFYKDSISESYNAIYKVDMARETSDFLNNQLMLQTTTALLAQANNIPRVMLNLLSR
ncbi:hypothetical protein AB751O23_AP_00140 [Chlamydiales bacterium SCGC AB-751-O23]|jgi:flagellin|nr:hypothetical protein AB751O23_AP_00140 [Chlamydiales bacterium SCGC AB-751-O23]